MEIIDGPFDLVKDGFLRGGDFLPAGFSTWVEGAAGTSAPGGCTISLGGGGGTQGCRSPWARPVEMLTKREVSLEQTTVVGSLTQWPSLLR